MWLAQVISIPLGTLLLYAIYNLPRMNRRLVVAFTAYGLWFLALFLSYAPGCFTEDTFYTLGMVRNGWWNAWYSVLHPALMTAFVQILPLDFLAPGIFLSLSWAVTYTLMHGLLMTMQAPRACHIAVPIVALLPPQITASLIIIRDSFFTAFFLAFLLAVVWAMRTKPSHWRILCAIALLGGLVMIYRTDAAPAVAVGLFAVLAASRRRGAVNRAETLKAAVSIVGPVLGVALLAMVTPRLLDHNWIRGNTWDARARLEYKLTLIESPLGYIVKHGGSRISASEQAAIEKVFRFSDLRQHYCPGNLCLFYGGLWNKESTKRERDRAFRAALAVFVKHPLLFLESRRTTLDTVGEPNTQTSCDRMEMKKRGHAPLFLHPGLSAFGQTMVHYVKGTERVDGMMGGARVWWNVYLNALIALLIALCAAWTPAVSLVALLLLIRTAVVAAVAPAGFTVYYLALFIGTPLLLILMHAARYDRRRQTGRPSAHGTQGAPE